MGFGARVCLRGGVRPFVAAGMFDGGRWGLPSASRAFLLRPRGMDLLGRAIPVAGVR